MGLRLRFQPVGPTGRLVEPTPRRVTDAGHEPVIHRLKSRARFKGEAEGHSSSQRLVCKRKRITNPYGVVFFLLTRPLMGDLEPTRAQKALESGCREPDREVLGRLTRKGMDMPGEPPLFPDLDRLYTALDALDAPEDEK